MGEPEADLRQTARNLWGEIDRRLADPALAADLPGTKLIDLAERMRGLLEDEPPPAAGEPEPTVAEVIAGIEGLPLSRKREILERERKLMIDEVAAIDEQFARWA